jgi:RNA polymerase sigma factor (sigma-70 family)
VEASALSAPAGLGRGSSTSPWLRLRSDEQLVGLFRSGNEEAFRVIHDRYRQRLYGYARQMLGGSGSDAEDVMQDVFLRAYRALRVDERPVSLRAWLYRVAHNRCVDSLRRPVPALAEVLEMSRTPGQDTLVLAERREDLRRLIEDVRRLPEQQRSALLMREMDGMSYADLAVALDTTVPAIKSLLVRARIGLVDAIEARDADCADIRHDLAASYDRGVRASGRARRHLRDCDGCTSYRLQLRAVRHGFASLSPAPAAGILAKLLGLGGSGAAAGGAAAGSGGTAAIGGGAAAAASITKVAALVCCAAALTGGAVEVGQIGRPWSHGHRSARHAEHTAPGIARPITGGRFASAQATLLSLRVASQAKGSATAERSVGPASAKRPANGPGGALAPPDPVATPTVSPTGGPATGPVTATGTADPATSSGASDPTTGSNGSGSGSASSSSTAANTPDSSPPADWGTPSGGGTDTGTSSSSGSSSSATQTGTSSGSPSSGGSGASGGSSTGSGFTPGHPSF